LPTSTTKTLVRDPIVPELTLFNRTILEQRFNIATRDLHKS
jgi:hypothetical protein